MKSALKIRSRKGYRMPPEVLENPAAYRMRVVVAFDAHKRTLPYLYVLNGDRCHRTEHQIRRTYTQTTACPYLDTRVILYETFVKRAEDNKEPIYFGNDTLNVIEAEPDVESVPLF